MNQHSDVLDQLVAYECGELDDDATISFFQTIIDSGLVWQLQGSYGRTARRLIDDGYCQERWAEKG